MIKCAWCSGSMMGDHCLSCGRSDNYEYERKIKEFTEKFEKGELEDQPINQKPVHNYGMAKKVTEEMVTKEMWETLKTGQIAELMGCSVSWISHLKPKKYKQKYIKRIDKVRS